MEAEISQEIKSQDDTEVGPVYNVIVGNVEQTEFDNNLYSNLVDTEASIGVESEQAKSNTAAILALSTPDEPFFHWDKTSIKMLIELYKEHIDLFDSPNIKKKKAWKIIAGGLVEKGLEVTYQQCESKWKNLQRNYRKVKYDMNTVGTTTSRWPYFKEIDEINGMRAAEQNDSLSAQAKCLDDASDVSDMGAFGIAGSSDNFLNRPTNGNIVGGRKRKLSDDEPAWFKSYRQEVNRRHEQRLALQKQIMEQHKLLTRQLIKVLECFKSK